MMNLCNSGGGSQGGPQGMLAISADKIVLGSKVTLYYWVPFPSLSKNVSFYNSNNVTIGTAPVVNRFANFTFVPKHTGSFSYFATAFSHSNFRSLSVKYSTKTTLTTKNVGNRYTFNASINPFMVTGNVIFYDGTSKLYTAPLTKGFATFTKNLSTGTHKITAYYSGDSQYFGSFSKLLVNV